MKKLTSKEITELLKAPETEKLECKEAKNALPRSFWESYSAFANTDGGIILLGVKEELDGFHIQGVDDVDKLMQDLWNSINNRQKISVNILFNRHVYAVDCDGKAVIVVEVPRALREDKPVFVRANPYNGTFRRNGEGDYRCDEEAVEAMIRDKCRETADHRIVENMTVADLNQDTLRRYRNLFRQCRPDDLTVNADDEEFLCRHGAAKRDEKGVVRPLLASVLMFGDFHTIQNECPHYFVDYREKLEDNPRYSDRVCPFTVGFSGNLFDFYFRVVSRLVADVKTPFRLNEQLLRVDDTPVHKALRECLANTLIHADYTGRRGVVIEKTFRHVTFANPGALRLPKDVAIAGGTSDARNDVIFTLFALVEIGEKLGTGLVQLFALWKERGWATPVICEEFNPERTILTLDYNEQEDKSSETGFEYDIQDGLNRSRVIEVHDGSYNGYNVSCDVNNENCDVNYTICDENSRNCDENDISCDEKRAICNENDQKCDVNYAICDENNKRCDGNRQSCDGKGKRVPVLEQEQQLLKWISQNKTITQPQLSKMTGLSPRTVFSRLRDLQRQGILCRVGPDKGGHWEVLAAK